MEPTDARKQLDLLCACDEKIEYEGIGQEEVAMIDHTGIGVADVRRSAAFYDAVLGALDLGESCSFPRTKGLTESAMEWITRSSGSIASTRIRSVSMSPSRPGAGPRSSPSTPPPCGRGHRQRSTGPTRGEPPAGYHAAFVLDPDGNNIEAVFREA